MTSFGDSSPPATHSSAITSIGDQPNWAECAFVVDEIGAAWQKSNSGDSCQLGRLSLDAHVFHLGELTLSSLVTNSVIKTA